MTDTNTPNQPMPSASEMGFRVSVRAHQGGTKHGTGKLVSHHSIEASRGVLATATDQTGGTLRRAPTGNDRVTVGGIEMKASDAARLGYLNADAAGNVTDATPEQIAARDRAAQEAEAEASQPDTEHAFAWEPEEAQFLGEFSHAASAYGVSPAGIIAEVLASPDKLPSGIQYMVEASQGRVSIDDAMTMVARGGQAIEAALDDYAERRGVPAHRLPALWQEAMRSHKHHICSAVIQGVYQGDARGLDVLIDRFMKGERLAAANHAANTRKGR